MQYTRTTGTVKSFNLRSGHGFIAPDSDAKAFWVHGRNVRDEATLHKGDRVEFETREGGMGPEAMDVTIMLPARSGDDLARDEQPVTSDEVADLPTSHAENRRTVTLELTRAQQEWLHSSARRAKPQVAPSQRLGQILDEVMSACEVNERERAHQFEIYRASGYPEHHPDYPNTAK